MLARRHVAAILAVAFAMLFAPPAGAASKSPSPMVDKINEVRRAHGLRPARYSRSLSGSSAWFARQLARTQRFTHGARIGGSSRFSTLGEVLALMHGWKIRRSRTLAYWLTSPSHRAVLLSPAFRYVGAARARGYFFGSRTMFWTVQLGR
jgi:uncharacterized protein YkwD